MCSTCFGHSYAHHRELETILVLLPHMVCSALVAGGGLLGVEQQAVCPGCGKLCELHNFPHPGRIACCSTPNSRTPVTKASHTICGNKTSIVSSSCWWAYERPQHVEQILIAIKHSVASSWFSSLRLYYDAWTNIHQITRSILIFPGALGYCELSVLRPCTPSPSSGKSYSFVTRPHFGPQA
jgi:hypothetical protein